LGKEKRSLLIENLRTVEENEQKILSGYVNKFNTLSEDMGFFEKVQKGAFTRSLKEKRNILALFNHDTSKVLGSTDTETLTLSEDDVGLFFELRMNENLSYTKDIIELSKTGLLKNCSFGFEVLKEDWEEESEDVYVRTIQDVNLFEITLTSLPAYQETEFSLRSLENFKNEKGLIVKRQKEIQKDKLIFQLSLLDVTE
jgi:HK97 family phage prohead protease